MRTPFRFKQFSVADVNSAMKVNTDAVLLGAWCDVEHANRVLDIGTGCGIIALMVAQRSFASVDAIDIDEKSIRDASFNFASSPYRERLRAFHTGLEQFIISCDTGYEHIVCNPPFFYNSLAPQSDDNKVSKHAITLKFPELITGISHLLFNAGSFSIILPANGFDVFDHLAKSAGFYLKRKTMVLPKISKPANRVLAEFTRCNQNPATDWEEMVIRNPDDTYSENYKKLTGEFYLFND